LIRGRRRNNKLWRLKKPCQNWITHEA
jgi:hypothetical protein